MYKLGLQTGSEILQLCPAFMHKSLPLTTPLTQDWAELGLLLVDWFADLNAYLGLVIQL